MLSRRSFLGGLALTALSGCARPSRQIALVASSLEPWLAPLAERFQLACSYGGSRTLVRQVEGGAVVDLLLLADDLKLPAHFTPARPFGGNRLVLVARRRSCQLSELHTARRIALGDPALAPVGQYARQSLEHLQLWKEVSPRLVLTRDDRSSLLLLESGHADLALIYRSDLQGRPDLGEPALLPEDSHPPIRYWASVRQGAGPGAQNFLDWLGTPPGRASLESAGLSTAATP